MYGLIRDDFPKSWINTITSFTQAIQTSLDGPFPACSPPALDLVSNLNFEVRDSIVAICSEGLATFCVRNTNLGI